MLKSAARNYLQSVVRYLYHVLIYTVKLMQSVFPKLAAYQYIFLSLSS